MDQDVTADAKGEDPKDLGSLAAVLDKLSQTLDRQSKTTDKPKEDERVYTSSELQSLVDEGKISQTQMLDQLRMQDAKAIERKFEDKLSKQEEARRADSALDQKISAYVTAVPDLAFTDSDAYKRFQAQLDDLASEGEDPNSKRTQLLALKLEFGKPTAKRDVQETTRMRKASSEVSGGPGSSRSGSDDSSGSPSWLPSDIAAHYESNISKGRYEGWEDPQLRRELIRLRARYDGWTEKKMRAELAKVKTEAA